jgi:Sec-independent protein translocase protein TatA
MTILTSIILVAVIVVGTAFLAYYMQRGTKTLKEFKTDFDNNAEVQELADLAKELYNKDLRPVAPKTVIKKKKSEFPIDKPAKKTKAVEAIAEVTTPEVVEKVVEIAKVVPEVTTINVEAVVETAKPKKKRKYYPRKK